MLEVSYRVSAMEFELPAEHIGSKLPAGKTDSVPQPTCPTSDHHDLSATVSRPPISSQLFKNRVTILRKWMLTALHGVLP